MLLFLFNKNSFVRRFVSNCLISGLVLFVASFALDDSVSGVPASLNEAKVYSGVLREFISKGNNKGGILLKTPSDDVHLRCAKITNLCFSKEVREKLVGKAVIVYFWSDWVLQIDLDEAGGGSVVGFDKMRIYYQNSSSNMLYYMAVMIFIYMAFALMFRYFSVSCRAIRSCYVSS